MHHHDSALSRLVRSRGTVFDLFSGRNNSLGLLRLLLASAVVVSHARILGFGDREFGYAFSSGQIDLGSLAVFGFFVLSGLLITRSGNRLPVGRFLWHRALRLLPGLWVCLTATALVVAPLLYWRQHGSTAGYWQHPQGPLAYLRANWAIGISQWGISGVMETAHAQGLAFNNAFDGALWSLKYEVLCYLGVALLALTGSLTRARRAVLAVTVLLGWLVLSDAIGNRYMSGALAAKHGGPFDVPLMGALDVDWVVYLGFAFALGSLIELYKERVPISDPLAALAAATLLITLSYGYFFAIGVPAYAYLLLWLAIRLPRPLQKVGRTHDYSYGIYIYGFVVEQALATLGGARWGFGAYLGLALGGTLIVAMLSWHLVERPAMRLKDRGRFHSVVRADTAPQPVRQRPRRTGSEAPAEFRCRSRPLHDGRIDATGSSTRPYAPHG
ncbi:acyltransferase [Streptomyces sp. SID13666]|uniref:acyltransferase family protein n=1 Tax=unclassified Streptomyces TaxID=2593676 RepID=UPI0013BF759D|nr:MULTISPECIES: acyltransferase [unclassified Streptomyces]NEA54819.1 acyltransferase [Streptomyces sp. SID13666]NEA70610.1 acyltransferase [Streptomyces sp. SID13588]